MATPDAGDRMQAIRDAGRVRPGDELSLLFRGLSTLEAMVEAVKEDRDVPEADPALAEELSRPASVDAEEGEAPAPAPVPEAAASRAEQSLPPDAPRPPPTVRVLSLIHI